ncbi:MAG: hypothetical protein QNJ55_32870 [Xenococcus sp. MO_188.B8]|nr:hypothetical protein [Xenococcus sp. MO_188.B8]
MTQFYQITLEQAIADYQLGKLTTFGLVDYYIKIKFAPGWKISIDPRKAIKELGITIHQFRRAISKIRETIPIALKITTQIIGKMPAENESAPNVNRVTPRVNHVTPSANQDRQTPNKTNASSDSPYIGSNIYHISLSKTEQTKPIAKIQKLTALKKEEREKFLEFAFQKVDELPKRPTLPKRWINTHFEELYSEWKKQAAPETQQATKDKQFAEWYDLMHQLGHVTGQKIENGIQFVKDVCGTWNEYEFEAQFYSLEYLRKCVSGK